MIDRNSPQYQEAKWRVKIGHAFLEKGYDINGVVHVGTNDGYEFQWYRQLGIEYFLGFEPLPSAVTEFHKNYPDLVQGKERLFPFALGNKNETRVLMQATGDGQNSTFLEPIHKEEFIGQHYLTICRFKDVIESYDIQVRKFDCLVCDVQGMELDVLKGMGVYLRGFKYLNIECSRKPRYFGSASAQEIIDFLAKFDFNQDSPIEDHNDIFFIKQ